MKIVWFSEWRPHPKTNKREKKIDKTHVREKIFVGRRLYMGQYESECFYTRYMQWKTINDFRNNVYVDTLINSVYTVIVLIMVHRIEEIVMAGEYHGRPRCTFIMYVYYIYVKDNFANVYMHGMSLTYILYICTVRYDQWRITLDSTFQLRKKLFIEILWKWFHIIEYN